MLPWVRLIFPTISPKWVKLSSCFTGTDRPRQSSSIACPTSGLYLLSPLSGNSTTLRQSILVCLNSSNSGGARSMVHSTRWGLHIWGSIALANGVMLSVSFTSTDIQVGPKLGRPNFLYFPLFIIIHFFAITSVLFSHRKMVRIWPHRLTARTLGSHPRNRSSILRGATKWDEVSVCDEILAFSRTPFHKRP